MATLMLEGDADLRLIQEILGHAELGTTDLPRDIDLEPAEPTADDVLATLEAEAREEASTRRRG